MSAPQFRGQQLATGAVLFLAFPAMNLFGVHPFGPWPVWLWAAAFAAGGYWYVRNLIQGGNPLPWITSAGPVELSMRITP